MSILVPKTTKKDVNVVVAAASEAKSVVVTTTKTQVELLVGMQTRLETRIIGSSNVVFNGTALLYFELTQTVVRRGHPMSARAIMEINPSVRFDLLVANEPNIAVHVPKHMVRRSSTDNMLYIVDPEQVYRGRSKTVAALQAKSKPLVHVHERLDAPNIRKYWTNIVNIPPEYASYRTRFTNIVEQFQEMWDGALENIKIVRQTDVLSSPGARLICAVPYHAGPSGTSRFCVDYRKRDTVTPRDSYA